MNFYLVVFMVYLSNFFVYDYGITFKLLDQKF